uniref:Uncharacterized protein n=1 Tax=Sipha flava TaxID=143950 RepID=A0A2S2R285_9HEMI
MSENIESVGVESTERAGIEARTVRAKEFLRHLSIFLKGENHNERRNSEKSNEVELMCFVEHMNSANNLMTEPYDVTEVLHISIPIVGFAQEVIDSQTSNLICNELGNILEELIEDGVL